MKLKVILENSEDGGYTVYAPSLPGCISEGETKKEALNNIREAIELYLEPVPDDLFIAPGYSEITEIVL
jgi:predicted RNase H-like HicB family nuclease